MLRPVAREGLQNLGSFLATKWAQNVVILVALGLGPRRVGSKGAPHPPRINHGYRPGGKTAQLAISTAAILKEGVDSVNHKSVERAFCFCLFVFVFLITWHRH